MMTTSELVGWSETVTEGECVEAVKLGTHERCTECGHVQQGQSGQCRECGECSTVTGDEVQS